MPWSPLRTRELSQLSVSNCPTCGVEYEIGEDVCPGCDVELPPIIDQPIRSLTGVVLAGRYELRERVGAGAMGAIYLARHLALEREICVKVMHPHVAADPKLVRRFHREARAASRLEHKNIIAVMDFGEDTVIGAKDREEDLLYLVMEYVDGQDLSNILVECRRLDPQRAIQIIQQIAHALEEAHRKGIVHRDLKPENIMIYHDRDGVESVKVLDFGIAKIMQQDGEDRVTQLTMVGTVCGTPEYMSPEQARGKEMDGRSDLYSLGVLLYQLVTGTVPYDGDSAIEIVTQHLTAPVPNPLERRPELPESVGNLIQRLMVKKPGGRPESATMVIKICDRVQEAIKNWEPSVAETRTDLDISAANFGSETVMDSSLTPTRLEALEESATRIMPARARARRFTSTDSLDLTAKIRHRKNKFWFVFAACLCVLIGSIALIAYKNREGRASVEIVELDEASKLNQRSKIATMAPSEDSLGAVSEKVEVVEEPPAQESEPAAVESEKEEPLKPAPSVTKPRKKLAPSTPPKPKLTAQQRRAKALQQERLGDQAKNSGNCGQAVRFYESAYRLNRSNKNILYKTGRCYLRMGSPKARRPLVNYLKSLGPAERKIKEPRIKMMLQQVSD